MAWNTAETQRRLKEAATIEFAEHGPDGTTMSQIATRAGINKERLYKYFGDKHALFEAVLADELARLAASITPPAGGLEDIGEFAGRTFDYYTGHPHLARLLLWEALAGEAPADEASRTEHYQQKTLTYAAAQQEGILSDALDADHLVFLIIALAAWWYSVPQLAKMITGAESDDVAEHARRRASVVAAAQQLALAPSPTDRTSRRQSVMPSTR